MAYNHQQVPFWDFTRGFEQNGAGVDHPAEGNPAEGFNLFGPPPPPGGHAPPPWGAGFPFGGPALWGQGPPHHGPGGWGGRFGRRGGWGGRGRGGHRGPPPFGCPGGFDLNALIESLSAHPIAQALRTMAETQRSGETLVPEDADAENSFIPPVDVFSTEKAFVLHVALPGAKKEDVGVNWDTEKGLLNLAGVVYRQGDEEFLKTLSKSERKVGVFERTVKLPPGSGEEEIDGDAITAKLEDGVLVVIVPKVEKEEKWTEVKKVDIV
jgi:HSP20 family protein